jgi:hypothetical protein
MFIIIYLQKHLDLQSVELRLPITSISPRTDEPMSRLSYMVVRWLSRISTATLGEDEFRTSMNLLNSSHEKPPLTIRFVSFDSVFLRFA